MEINCYLMCETKKENEKNSPIRRVDVLCSYLARNDHGTHHNLLQAPKVSLFLGLFFSQPLSIYALDLCPLETDVHFCYLCIEGHNNVLAFYFLEQ